MILVEGMKLVDNVAACSGFYVTCGSVIDSDGSVTGT